MAAGERKRHTQNLSVGHPELELLPSAEHAALESVGWRRFDVAGEQSAYSWDSPPGQSFTLPKGASRVTATGGGFPDEMRVTLGAGE